LKVPKFGAGEGCGKSAGPIEKEKKYYTTSRKKGTSYIQYNDERLTGLVGNAF